MTVTGSSPQDAARTPPRVSARMWVQAIVVIVLIPAVLLFSVAGTLRWFMAWLYLLLTLVTFAVSRLIVWRVHPDLLAERGRMMDHEDTAAFDRVLAPLLALVGPTLVLLVAALAVRFDWQPPFAPWLTWLGVALFLLGAALGSWALVVNRFFSGVVRIQTDRGHHVVSTGPYAFVRHPGYLGALVSYLGTVLMLGSPWALLPFALEMAVLVARTRLEDQLLQAQLPGYAAYARQVRYRLLPGIW